MSDVQPTPVFEASESIAQLAEALAKAQGAMTGAAKDATNPHFRSKYADLASNIAAAREPLSANGLSVVQVPGTPRLLPAEQVAGWDKNGKEITRTLYPCEVFLHSRLLHSSGEWIGGTISMRSNNSDPQSVGSCLTYARRYAFAALVGTAPEDPDDDGENAMGRGKGNTQQPTRKPPPKRTNGTQQPKPATQEQRIRAALAFVSACESFDDLAKFADNGAMTIEDEVKRGQLQHQINASLHAAVLQKEIAKADAKRLEEITEWLNGRVMDSEHAGDIIEWTADRNEQLAAPAT